MRAFTIELDKALSRWRRGADIQADQLATAERTGKAHQQQRSIALAKEGIWKRRKHRTQLCHHDGRNASARASMRAADALQHRSKAGAIERLAGEPMHEGNGVAEEPDGAETIVSSHTSQE